MSTLKVEVYGKDRHGNSRIVAFKANGLFFCTIKDCGEVRGAGYVPVWVFDMLMRGQFELTTHDDEAKELFLWMLAQARTTLS